MVDASRADHPGDTERGDEREYAVVLVIDRVWTDMTGVTIGTAVDDPEPIVVDLFENEGVRTYVVSDSRAGLGDFPVRTSTGGGTGLPTEYSDPDSLQLALDAVLTDIVSRICFEELLHPPC